MKDEKYIKSKLRDIEGACSVISGVASFVALMDGKVTDATIKARDTEYKRIEKIVYQIIKRVSK